MRVDKPTSGADTLARILLSLAFAATLVFAAASAIVRPATYSDIAIGFRVWDSMRQGAGFNQMLNVDPADIGRDLSYFKAAWSPGQYLLPGALETLGLDLGLAITVVVTLASLAGLWGWYLLYRAFGFSPRIAAVALLIVVFGRHFALPFGAYNGGEVLLFGGLPWGFLVVWRWRDLPWRSIPALLAATAGMVFLKLSGIAPMAAAILAVVPSGDHPLFGRETVRKAAVAGVTIVVAALLLHWGWTSRGWTAVETTASQSPAEIGASLALVVSSTWTAIFGFGSLLQFIFFFPGRALLSSPALINVALLVPAIATLAFMVVRLRRGYPAYLRFSLIVTALVTGFLFLLLVRGSAIGTEERHFRPAALLLTVGMVEAFLGVRSMVVRGLFAGLAGLSVLYGAGSWAHHLRTNLHDTLGLRGVRLHTVPVSMRDFLRAVDRRDADGDRPLVLVPSPETALEIRNARILTTDADFQTAQALAAEVRRGRVRRLYVVLPLALERNGKAEIILTSFADYRPDDWKRIVLGDSVVYASVP